jgi:hypothetical protein
MCLRGERRYIASEVRSRKLQSSPEWSPLPGCSTFNAGRARLILRNDNFVSGTTAHLLYGLTRVVVQALE